MNLSSRIRVLLSALLVATAVGACDDVRSDLPTAASDALMVALAPGGNPGKPGGGGEDDDNGVDVTTTFRDAADAIGSDGAGSYQTIKKKQQIKSEFGWLEVNESSGREVCVTFPPEGPDAQILSGSDWSELVVRWEAAEPGDEAGLGEIYCGIVTMHLRDQSAPIPDMDIAPATAEPDVITAGGKLVLKGLADPVGTWEWRLLFDDNHTTVNGGQAEMGICMRYSEDANGEPRWEAGTDPTLDDGSEDPTRCDAIDEYVNLIRLFDGDFVHVARFRMPFRYELTR